jgi:hydrogenase maturation protein HypF
VATSGNISGSPILYNDEDALNAFSTIADYVVTHNREIVVPQDDSVMQFSPQFHLPVILRRARGWAPTYFNYKNNTNQTILATGALLKSSFALLHHQQVFISQYLGNTDSLESQQTFQQVLHHVVTLLNVKVQTIVTDLHPLYFSHQYAYQISKAWHVPIKEVQHHEAHFAAILGEHHLQLQNEPVLGVVWDGTGLGNDGNMWGGEFFYYHEGIIQRYAHVGYFPFLLGDKMPREPRISALSICYGLSNMEEVLKQKFTTAEWRLYGAMLQQPASLFTSSIGRIFDAVASLLNLCNVQSYEGEAALMLEMLAMQYVQQHGLFFPEAYTAPIQNGNIFMKEFMNGILEDIVKHKKPPGFIAAKLHYSLACMVQQVAQQTRVTHIAFSGGVFQNALLVDMLYALLKKNYNLYFHKQLSSNDENISFGQMVYADWNMCSLTDANGTAVQECDATTVAMKIKS